jgi:hypothetical protein
MPKKRTNEVVNQKANISSIFIIFSQYNVLVKALGGGWLRVTAQHQLRLNNQNGETATKPAR